jgi:hypothetical protein
LRQLPSGPGSFLRSALFPIGAKLALLREPFVGPARGGGVDRAPSSAAGSARAWLERAVAPFVSVSTPATRAAVDALGGAAGCSPSSAITAASFAVRSPSAKGRRRARGLLGARGGFEDLARRLGQRLDDLRTATR